MSESEKKRIGKWTISPPPSINLITNGAEGEFEIKTFEELKRRKGTTIKNEKKKKFQLVFSVFVCLYSSIKQQHKESNMMNDDDSYICKPTRSPHPISHRSVNICVC